MDLDDKIFEAIVFVSILVILGIMLAAGIRFRTSHDFVDKEYLITVEDKQIDEHEHMEGKRWIIDKEYYILWDGGENKLEVSEDLYNRLKIGSSIVIIKTLAIDKETKEQEVYQYRIPEINY